MSTFIRPLWMKIISCIALLLLYEVTTLYAQPSAPEIAHPTNITSTSFRANWQSVPNVITYLIDVSNTPAFSSFIVNNVNTGATYRDITGLSPNTIYYYRVRVVVVGEPQSSANSAVQFAITGPKAPIVSINNTSYNNFAATWDAVSGATGYKVDVSLSGDFLTTVGAYNNFQVSGTSMVVTELSPVKVYFFRVRAFHDSAPSDYSNIESTTTLIAPPDVPVAQASTNKTMNSFTAKWNAAARASGYRIDVATNSGFSTFVPGYNNLSVNTTSVNVSGLSEKTAYYYRVRAVNASGTSGNSNIVSGLNLSMNYVRTVDVLKTDVIDANQLPGLEVADRVIQTSYFDGLGRTLQVVTQQASPLQQDVVQPTVYDAYGRESKKYLPIVSGSDGWFKSITYDANTGNYNGTVAGKFYNNNSNGKIAQDIHPYNEMIFEPSPLNRLLKNYGPGSAWGVNSPNNPGGNDKPQQLQYLVNIFGTGSSAAQEKIISWKVAANTPTRVAALTGYVEEGGYYSSGQLSIKVTTDEEGNAVREYTDRDGHVVLKKVQSGVSSDNLNSVTAWALTYYIYDDFGNLAFVFPPELSKKIHVGSSTSLVDSSDLINWAFQYRYDSRKRMIQKRIPGAYWLYMIYDNRDRLVLTQDGNQRDGSVKNWSFTKYDQYNRPVMTGFYTDASSLSGMQAKVNNFYSVTTPKWYEEVTVSAGNIHNYTNQTFPQEADKEKYLTITYYDSYLAISRWPLEYQYNNDFLVYTIPGKTVPGYRQSITFNPYVNGLITGMKVKVLDVSGYSWLRTTNYYDDKNRLIQTVAENYKRGLDRISNLYDFSGKKLKSKNTHSTSMITCTKVNSLRKEGNILRNILSGSGIAGASSLESLAPGKDGWIEFTANEINKTRYIGLSSTDTNLDWSTIDYAFCLLSDGTAQIKESGVIKKQNIPYYPGDVFRIARTGVIIQYYQNGVLRYTSSDGSGTLLIADVTATAGATISNLCSSFSARQDSVITTYDYDHAARLINTWHRYNNGINFLLAKNEYNELGQLVDKKLHSTDALASTRKQSVDMRYNIRGWLTSINNVELQNASGTNDDTNDLFGMELSYNESFAGLAAAPRYNGNISSAKWSSNAGLGAVKSQGYVFTYDALNRLSTASHKTSSSLNAWLPGAYDENIGSYDLNGNIKALDRKGEAGAAIDQLTYSYNTGGNKLTDVSDNASSVSKSRGFADGNLTPTADYEYDLNGNMIVDRNKGITAIRYNHMNLPYLISKGGDTLRYIYDATGRKVSQWASLNYSVSNDETDYLGDHVYENGVLQYVYHDEGRVVVTRPKTKWTDHGESVSGFTGVSATLSTQNVNGETYVKVVANNVSGTAGLGAFPIGSVIDVLPGERYKIRVKAYCERSSGVPGKSHIKVQINNIDYFWKGATIPAKISGTSATNESWIEQVVTIPVAGPMKVGVVWMSNASGETLWINEVEVVKLNTAQPEYQYDLKDHLGNVRLTFTTVEEIESDTATLELGRKNNEREKFLRYDNARIVNHYLFDRTRGSSPSTAAGGSQRLSGQANEIYGLSKSISVMPGDVINMEVYAKYLDKIPGNRSAALNSLVAQIAAGASASGGIVVDGGGYSVSTSTFPFAIGLNGTTSSSGTGPKAYLNWLVFDRSYVLIPGKSGYRRLSNTPKEKGQDIAHEKLVGSVTIGDPGYVYIYLSNEEGAGAFEVYFDDFKVEQVKSPTIQSQDYYPFGLTFNSYKRENNIENTIRFQRQEHIDDLGLNWDLFKWRNHQPDIGRFFNVDPLADKYVYNSPYAFSENHVTVHVELEGLEKVYVFDQATNPDNRSSHTADVYVEHDNGTVNGPYSGSSYPNSSSKYNTLSEGTHQYNNESGHKGGSKQGLNIVDSNGKREAPGANPAGEDVTMTVVNVHAEFQVGNRGSEGCPTIETSDAKAFFANFDWSGSKTVTQSDGTNVTYDGTTGTSNGTITIYRGESDESNADTSKIVFRQETQRRDFQKQFIQDDLKQRL